MRAVERESILISNFMGWLHQMKSKTVVIHKMEAPDSALTSTVEWLSPRETEYHKSWDWIMPVIKKINEVANDALVTPHELLREPYFREITKAVMGSDFIKTYEWVVKTIEWLNNREV